VLYVTTLLTMCKVSWKSNFSTFILQTVVTADIETVKFIGSFLLTYFFIFILKYSHDNFFSIHTLVKFYVVRKGSCVLEGYLTVNITIFNHLIILCILHSNLWGQSRPPFPYAEAFFCLTKS
jgi:hypothetical protein